MYQIGESNRIEKIDSVARIESNGNFFAGIGMLYCEATSNRLIASAERPVTIMSHTIGLSVTGKKPVSANRFRKINGFNIPSYYCV